MMARVQGMSSRMILILAMALCLILPLCACGKKPDMVDPPSGVVKDKFPRAYPDGATDPDATVPAPMKPMPAPARQRSYF